MREEKFKRNVFNIVFDMGAHSKLSYTFEALIIGLVIFNAILAVADTFELPQFFHAISHVVEMISVVVFSLEYIARWWTADLLYVDVSPTKARLRYTFSFMSLLDLLAVLPFYVPFWIPYNLHILHALRVIRLLWMLKLTRYTHALSAIGNVLKKKVNQLFSSLIVVLLLMLIASVIMFNVENTTQPEVFKNALSGLWWAVSALTSSGHGDIYPITSLGRALGSVISILGIGLVAIPTGIITAGFVENSVHNEVVLLQTTNGGKRFCPYCGKLLGQTTSNLNPKKLFCSYCGEKLED